LTRPNARLAPALDASGGASSCGSLFVISAAVGLVCLS
jgi:hypothetical protein